LLHHKKTAFLKFFITYFLSVAILILIAGFFYFKEIKGQLLKAENFSLIEYARRIKKGENIEKFKSMFHHSYIKQNGIYIDIKNFKITKNEFIKYIPTRQKYLYLVIYKSKKRFEQKLFDLKLKIILIQLLLLLIFAIVSYYLAKSALKPLEESIDTLDKFAKDLIHDINTPITAMKLNIRLLEKNHHTKETKAIKRLKKSIETISELRENLTILLEKKTFQVTYVNICSVVKDVLQLHQPNYPHINFKLYCDKLFAKTNTDALKQVLHNLISNACKYNTLDGYVKIYVKKNKLYIENSGIEIKETDKVFNREYSLQGSSGIGLDIVKRLCDAMNIKIEVNSNKNENCFILIF